MYYKVVKWRRQKYREGARLSEGLNLSSSRVGLWGGFVAAMQAPADPSREVGCAGGQGGQHGQVWAQAVVLPLLGEGKAKNPHLSQKTPGPWVHLGIPVPVFPRGRDHLPVPGSSWGASSERPLRRNCGSFPVVRWTAEDARLFLNFLHFLSWPPFPGSGDHSLPWAPVCPWSLYQEKGTEAFCSTSGNASFPKALLPAVDATSLLKPTGFLPIPALECLGPTWRREMIKWLWLQIKLSN